MDLLAWAFFALAAASALVVVGYLYRRRETPGRGRTLLAMLRWAALALLILLLFDPSVPAPGLGAGSDGTFHLLDTSLSMTLPAAAGDSVTRWQRAADEAREGAGRVMLFGDAARVVSADSLAGVRPASAHSRLLPALQAASEAGARRVVVWTDGGIEDAAAVARVLPRLGVELDVRTVADGAVPNYALAEVEAPSWAETDEPMDVRVGVTSLAADDSVDVVVRHEGEVVAEARVAAPGPGRIAGATLKVAPRAPEGGGLVRYDVEIAAEDAAVDDNRRSVYVYVSDEPAGVALVSFRPDWEPRFLHPTLVESLDLPVRSYLRVGDGRYLRLGKGLEAGRPVPAATVRSVVEQADLVVLHGLGADAPAWARAASRDAERVLIFPAQDARALDLPVSPAGPSLGDWYPAADLPASPVASLLTSVAVEELPPLPSVRTARGAAGAWAPLVVQRNRRGTAAPALVAGEEGGRRFAVALAEGYWRWAFRGGEARQAYRRLWSAMTGWLMEDARDVASSAVRPARRAVERGRPVRWIAPGLAADSIAVAVSDRNGETVADTVAAVLQGDTATTGVLAPGHYRYRARAFADGEVVAESDGSLTIEAYSPEFSRASASLAGLTGGARGVDGGDGPGGVPLHTTPWPYVLLLLLLSAEWIGRRRWGLR